VEKSAVSNVFTPEEYAEHKKRLKQERSQKEGTPTKLTQQETMGDFYFETRNYEAALEQYKEALHENPGSHRLHKKVAASNYNIGVQFIKRRQYDRALAIMEDVLRADPANGHARKKSLQLRKIIERSKQAG
jgi:Tfp pilus assembly protein PilF